MLDALYCVEGARFFSLPVVTYFAEDSTLRTSYESKVANPIDLGSITVRLHTGAYGSPSDFAADVELMVRIENCISIPRSFEAVIVSLERELNRVAPFLHSFHLKFHLRWH